MAELIGVDLNPRSQAAAEAKPSPGAPIRYVTGDYADLVGGGFDCVVSSLVTHHMTHSQLIAFLRFMEAEMETRGAQFDPVAGAERLDRLERQANQLNMPIAYASMLYLLRNHIALVRDRLKAALPSPAVAASSPPPTPS